MNTYRYSFEKTMTADDVLPLFAQTDWAAKRTAAGIRAMLENTPVCLGVWDGERLIGFVRVVTDDIYRAVIEDVVLDEAYRGQGVGAEMMRVLMERLAHIEEVALVCVDRMIPFYERFGFERFTMTHMHLWKGSA